MKLKLWFSTKYLGVLLLTGGGQIASAEPLTILFTNYVTVHITNTGAKELELEYTKVAPYSLKTDAGATSWLGSFPSTSGKCGDDGSCSSPIPVNKTASFTVDFDVVTYFNIFNADYVLPSDLKMTISASGEKYRLPVVFKTWQVSVVGSESFYVQELTVDNSALWHTGHRWVYDDFSDPRQPKVASTEIPEKQNVYLNCNSVGASGVNCTCKDKKGAPCWI